MTKWIYGFGKNKADGGIQQCDILGSKGANLAEMSNLGLPVPPGFTITTKVCSWYYKHNYTYPSGLAEQVDQAIKQIGVLTGRLFGDSHNPLLLSVRSGARASMPGMMDTVLNLGLNDKTVQALAIQANERFAYDSYRRFIQMFSNVVFKIDHSIFEDLLENAKTAKNYQADKQMQAIDWQQLIEQYKNVVAEELGEPFPQDPQKQLWGAIGAVFSSWMNTRAIIYRQLHSIPTEWGTAVNIQAMVFGNIGNDCATGVAFTRNPSTGFREIYGEFLVNAQGEDVVSGIRIPQNITETGRILAGSDKPSLEKLMPLTFADLSDIAYKLEAHYRDMQDIEFTIEKGKIWILQTRLGKRTVRAALKIATQMAQQNIITRQDAVLRIDSISLEELLHPIIDPNATYKALASGLPASPGAAIGEIVFSSEDAKTAVEEGRKVVLVRIETSPEDIYGMKVAEGILTARGGMTSHAAVIARGMGKPCVCGVSCIKINYQTNKMFIGGVECKKGDVITIDGDNGRVFLGRIAIIQPPLLDDFADVMQWADDSHHMKVRANIETLDDARVALSLGAQGICLYRTGHNRTGHNRTGHMFFTSERITIFREIILAKSEEERCVALSRFLFAQRSDFIELFQIIVGLPVAIRLLDQSLYECLPKTLKEIDEFGLLIGVDERQLIECINALRQFSPMPKLCDNHFAGAYPDMMIQARVILEATAIAAKQTNNAVIPEIIVPLFASKAEFDCVKKNIDDIALAIMNEQSVQFLYKIGVMIESPEAVLLAKKNVRSADFVSFGTKDVIQMTYGVTCDDAVLFLDTYLQKCLFTQDSFVPLNIDGVGELIGEDIGVDYVSCLPFRVPIVRLVAAQAALKRRRI